MKIAYLILAHRNPQLIGKIIKTLSCADTAFFLHIDKKSIIDDFVFVQSENVFFSNERICVYWAEYSMVEAILILIQQALSKSQDFDYFVLLSGSDYPLRSKEYISKFFDKWRGAEFISMAKIPNMEAGLPLSKINTLSIPSNKPISRFIVRCCAKLGLAERDYRKYLGMLEPYGGSTWWALTRDACQYIVDFARDNEPVCRYFRNTLTSDETFFHTILGNSPFKYNVKRSLMYDDWSAGAPHPDLINDNHIDFFEAHEEVTLDDAFGPGELLFARKISDETLGLTERIDDLILLKDLNSNALKYPVNMD